jgi:arsenate reductase
MAVRLSPSDIGLQLVENVLAIVLVLAALILVFGPVSGAHFNPLVSIADWWLGRGSRTGLSARDLGGYFSAQFVGAATGAVLANVMFDLPAVTWSTTQRSGANLWLGEVVATAGLILLIFSLARSGQANTAPAAVAAYLAGAAWFTSSTAFVNPALTVARSLSDTFTGIAPGSVLGFIAAELLGLLIGLGLVWALYPSPSVVEAASGQSLTERVGGSQGLDHHGYRQSEGVAAGPPCQLGLPHLPHDVDQQRYAPDGQSQ